MQNGFESVHWYAGSTDSGLAWSSYTNGSLRHGNFTVLKISLSIPVLGDFLLLSLPIHMRERPSKILGNLGSFPGTLDSLF